MLESLYSIAKMAGLPFELSDGKLHYVGPEGKVEDRVLDLYEIIRFENPELASNLPNLDEVVPEYATYIRERSRERRIQRKIGNIECDGYCFYATDKALEDIAKEESFCADVAAYVSLLPRRHRGSTLKDKLESLGISTKKPSRLKAIGTATVMALAAAGGAAIAKDVSAHDSPEKSGADSRQSDDYQIEQITNDANTQWNPRISGDKMIWVDEGDIVIYDLKTKSKVHAIPASIISDERLDLENNYVAYINDNDEIRYYNLNNNTDTLIRMGDYPSNIFIQSGKIVWEDDIYYPFYNITRREIFWYDLLTGEIDRTGGVTVPSLTDLTDPSIYSNNIVYEEGGILGSYIILYDISSRNSEAISPHSNFYTRHFNPSIHKNKAAWLCEGGCYSELDIGQTAIIIHDLNSGENDIVDSYYHTGPSIYNDKVVWDNSGLITIYNITTKQITRLPTTYASYPDIYGDKVVWESNGDIFYVDLLKTAPVNQPPTAKFSLDKTIVKVGETVRISGRESSDPDGKIDIYYWDFEEWSLFSVENSESSYRYNTPGDYTITLQVRDDDGAWSGPAYATIHVLAPDDTDNSTLDSKIKQYAPTFILSKDENYLPAPPEIVVTEERDRVGDNGVVSDNRENYDSDPTMFAINGIKPIVFAQKPKQIEDHTYYTYWLYYANNSVRIDEHEHDWEYVVVKVDKDGTVVNRAASFHLSKARQTENSSSPVFVEEDGHAMSFDKHDFIPISVGGLFKFRDGGRVLRPEDYATVALEDIINNGSLDEFGRYKSGPSDHAAGDLLKSGDGKLMWYFGQRALVPWKQEVYNDPSKAWAPSPWEQIIAEIGSPVTLTVTDLLGYDVKYLPNGVASITEDAVFIRQTTDADEYIYHVTGTENGTYNLTIVKVGGTGIEKFAATEIPIEKNNAHKYKIDWAKVEKSRGNSVTIFIDDDGDGAVDKTIRTDSNLTGKEFERLKSATSASLSSSLWYYLCGGFAAVGAAVTSAALYLRSKARSSQKPESGSGKVRDILPGVAYFQGILSKIRKKPTERPKSLPPRGVGKSTKATEKEELEAKVKELEARISKMDDLQRRLEAQKRDMRDIQKVHELPEQKHQTLAEPQPKPQKKEPELRSLSELDDSD